MAKNTFVINGKTYNAKPIDFNTMCDFEDLGLPLEDMARKNMSTIRTYFALCSNLQLSEAGKEIEQHIIAGGDISSIAEAMNEEMQASDFFRSLKETAESKNPANQSKETTETE